MAATTVVAEKLTIRDSTTIWTNGPVLKACQRSDNWQRTIRSDLQPSVPGGEGERDANDEGRGRIKSNGERGHQQYEEQVCVSIFLA